MYAIEFELFGDEAYLHPRWWIETLRLVQDPIQVCQLANILDGWCVPAEHSADLVQQFFAYRRILREQVHRPDDCNGGRFMSGGKKRQDMIMNLFLVQLRLFWVATDR